ncbi:hypothetical protein FE257_005914 [Aspergillus nanangensis]|uniref:Uncharacterized protein n=1 Tax=Aspergillus nanangensis TaxID=2582783 RepID=A0AAD4CPU9_ASPNN|nr:hypothetical protein FE257_005914 [Aspergillus nanangensis]
MPVFWADTRTFRINWDELDTDLTFLTCPELEAAKEDFEKYFGVKGMFLDRTAAPGLYIIRFIVIDLSLHLEEYTKPELVTLAGRFLRVLLTGGVTHDHQRRAPEMLKTLSELLTVSPANVTDEDWQVGHVIIWAMRNVIRDRVTDPLFRSLATDLQWVHTLHRLVVTLVDRHRDHHMEEGALLLLNHAAFMQDLRSSHGITLYDSPALRPFIYIAPVGAYQEALRSCGVDTSECGISTSPFDPLTPPQTP